MNSHANGTFVELEAGMELINLKARHFHKSTCTSHRVKMSCMKLNLKKNKVPINNNR